MSLPSYPDTPIPTLHPREGTGSRDYCESRKSFFGEQVMQGILSYRKDNSKVLRSQYCVWPSLTYGTIRSIFKKFDVNVMSLEGHFVQQWQHGELRTCDVRATLAPRALVSCNDARYNRLLKVVFVECQIRAPELFRNVL